MVRFSKFKLLYTLKLSFNGGQFYKEMSNLGQFKKCKPVGTGKFFNKYPKNGPIFKT